MTRTVEIPQHKWPSFLRMLNLLADGRPVRVEIAQRELGDQQMGDLLPLGSIDLETKGSERGKLIITVGGDRGELTHLVEQPTRITLGLNDAGEPQWLGIDEHGEATTIIHFERLPALESEYTVTPS
jgi:Family of unknown function (DUF5335)